MNIEHETSNVIHSATDFSRFKFPEELPTEEWAGDEVRSYANYKRPIANLFENDRELDEVSKNLYKSILSSSQNAVIYGCNVVETIINSIKYYEIQEGLFVYSGNSTNRIFSIYPRCEALSKQLEAEAFIDAGKDISLNIQYDKNSKEYSYSYIERGDITPTTGTSSTAVNLVSTLITAFGINETSHTIESHIVLPIFKNANTGYIFFNGTGIVHNSSLSNNSVKFAYNGITNHDDAAIDGTRIKNGTLTMEMISNGTIGIGNQTIGLGDTENTFDGINSINGVSTNFSNNKIIIKDGSNNNSITIDGKYTIDSSNAAAKQFSTSQTLSDNDKLPTSKAIKDYFGTSLSNSTLSHEKEETFEETATFSNGLKSNNIYSTGGVITDRIALNGNITVKGTGAASSTGASIIAEGGIYSKGDIMAAGDIVGTNTGTYSKRSLKENITPFEENAVDIINTVDVVNYNYISDKNKNHKIGFIADDTHEYLSTKKHDIMDQSNCIGLLIKAVQELSAENKALKDRLNSLEGK